MGYPLKTNTIRTEKLLYPDTGGKYGKNTRGSGSHWGWDLVAPCGTAVYAIGSGLITYIGPAGKLGQIIQLRFLHESTFYWAIYAHLSEIFVSNKPPHNNVAVAQLIGLTGNSGNAEDQPPHLHLEIATNDSLKKGKRKTIDPGLVLGSFLNDYVSGGATYFESSYCVDIEDVEAIERLGMQRTA
jgi:murein DD-endopeptidase MepM/ murein hydrolase activator NlpD